MKELPGAAVVVAARAGDRAALEDLVRGYLPLVYNVVGRAADRDLDVDDIVQDTMVRVVTGLAGLRDPERLRAWIIAIAMRELADARSQAGRDRNTRHDELPERSDPAADFEGAVLLREALTGEQHEIARATVWLDRAHRELVALWWFEQCGELTREDVADALGESLPAVAVRVHRMREQLDTCRAVVRALQARPMCSGLSHVLTGWDGMPSPLWRKRIARHLRECTGCSAHAERLPSAERLLAGLPLAELPAQLTGRVLRAIEALPEGTAVTRLSKKAVAAVAAVTVALGGGAVAYSTVGSERPDVAARPSATAPAPAVVGGVAQSAPPSPSVRRLAPFFDTVPAFPQGSATKVLGPVRQDARVRSRDGGVSATIGGKSVWLFADTNLQNPGGFLPNSSAVTTDLDAADGIDLRSAPPAEVIPKSAAEKAYEKGHPGIGFRFWTESVVADPIRHRFLITYGKLCRGGGACSGALGASQGKGIAAMDASTGKVTRLTVTGKTVTSVEGVDRTLLFGPDEVGYGGATVVAHGDDLYLYGGCQIHGCKVATVPLARVTDRAAWRYYDGKRFSNDPGAAAFVMAAGNGGQSVFYSAGLKAWVNVFLQYGGNTIRYQVGGSPYGPWSSETRPVATTRAGANTFSFAGHAEYAEDDGLVQYLTYYNPDSGGLDVIRWNLKP